MEFGDSDDCPFDSIGTAAPTSGGQDDWFNVTAAPPPPPAPEVATRGGAPPVSRISMPLQAPSVASRSGSSSATTTAMVSALPSVAARTGAGAADSAPPVEFVSATARAPLAPAAAPAAKAAAVPAASAASTLSHNPFACSESGEFTLSEHSSFEVSDPQNPSPSASANAAQPNGIRRFSGDGAGAGSGASLRSSTASQPAADARREETANLHQKSQPQENASCPPPQPATQPASASAATSQRSAAIGSHAAQTNLGTTPQVPQPNRTLLHGGAAAPPKVLEHNPFEYAAAEDPFGGDGSEEPAAFWTTGSGGPMGSTGISSKPEPPRHSGSAQGPAMTLAIERDAPRSSGVTPGEQHSGSQQFVTNHQQQHAHVIPSATATTAVPLMRDGPPTMPSWPPLVPPLPSNFGTPSTSSPYATGVPSTSNPGGSYQPTFGYADPAAPKPVLLPPLPSLLVPTALAAPRSGSAASQSSLSSSTTAEVRPSAVYRGHESGLPQPSHQQHPQLSTGYPAHFQHSPHTTAASQQPHQQQALGCSSFPSPMHPQPVPAAVTSNPPLPSSAGMRDYPAQNMDGGVQPPRSRFAGHERHSSEGSVPSTQLHPHSAASSQHHFSATYTTGTTASGRSDSAPLSHPTTTFSQKSHQAVAPAAPPVQLPQQHHHHHQQGFRSSASLPDVPTEYATPFHPSQPPPQQQRHGDLQWYHQEHPATEPPVSYPPPQHSMATSHGQQLQQATGADAAVQHIMARRRGPAATFAFGGKILFASLPVNGGAAPSVVTVSVKHVLLDDQCGTPSGKAYVGVMSSWPGCLTPQTKIDAVQKSLALVIDVSTPLGAILQLMCSKSLDWAKGGQQELHKIFQTAAATSAVLLSSSVSSEAPPMPWGQAEALATMQKLLIAGDRTEAVRCAMHYKLHTHALLIAMMCDSKDVYQTVVQSIIREHLDVCSPLAFAYCAFNELPPPELDAEQRVSALKQWTAHVAMLLANFTRESAESLLHLGDQLTEAGKYEEAHCCYLVAQLSPGGRPPQQAGPRALQVAEALRTRYLVLGGHYHRTKCRAAVVRPQSIFLTEVLEYSRQRENEKFVRAQLIPFRVMAAELYTELGMTSHAESYLSHLGKMLPTQQQQSKDGAAIVCPRTVADVLDMVRRRLAETQKAAAAQSAAAAKGGSGGGGWWPFSSSKATAKTPAATPTATAASSISRGSSANPVASSRSAASTSPPPPTQQQKNPATTGDAEPEPSRPQQQQPPPKSSRWSSLGIGNIFRRSPSQQQQQQSAKKESEKEAKEMIIDTEEPPTFDPVTGRWMFKKTAEEAAVEKQILAGPPKLPVSPMGMVATPGAPPSGGYPPSAVASTTGPGTLAPPSTTGLPPPPGPGTPGGLGQRRYIDMFNS